jgi:hypothetical protein
VCGIGALEGVLEHFLLPSMMMGGRRAMSVEWKEMPSSRIALILAHTTVLAVGNNGKEGILRMRETRRMRVRLLPQ